MPTVRAYSQRLMPPYSGQVQIAESGRARALTLDGNLWEIQFLHSADTGQWREQKRFGHPVRRSYIRVAMIRNSEIRRLALPSFLDTGSVDERIVELSEFLAETRLPFPASDHFEYWLLDPKDDSPLALIYSCTSQEEMRTYPSRPEWTALPAATMAIARTPEEEESYAPPVNYRLERLVAERAGQNPRAAWFNRRTDECRTYPPCLISEHWEDEGPSELCRRYLARQAPRLLMLHGLAHPDRARLEQAAREHALEVARFYPLYPAVADQELMAAIRVEARLRQAAAGADPLSAT